MAKTKIGDIFSLKLDDGVVKYFQLIAFDLTQLNSDVIRVFENQYDINDKPDLGKIVFDNVNLYAHCTTSLGLKLNLWEKVGNSSEIGDYSNVIFRDTRDYGSNEMRNSNVSNNWYIWKIGGDFVNVGKLEKENKNSYVGLVFNPLGIIELLKGNKYPVNYPDFE